MNWLPHQSVCKKCCWFFRSFEYFQLFEKKKKKNHLQQSLEKAAVESSRLLSGKWMKKNSHCNESLTRDSANSQHELRACMPLALLKFNRYMQSIVIDRYQVRAERLDWVTFQFNITSPKVVKKTLGSLYQYKLLRSLCSQETISLA